MPPASARFGPRPPASLVLALGCLAVALFAAACSGSSDDSTPPPTIEVTPGPGAPGGTATLGLRQTTIAGIAVGPSATPTVPCAAGEAREVPAQRLAGTGLEIAPRQLPAGTTRTSATATECRGVLIASGSEYSLEANPAGARRGGSLTIGRQMQSSRALPTAAPLDRAREVTVAGRRGVLVPPEVPGGDGLASLAIAEDWGLTTLVSTGLTEAQLLALAASLY